MTLSFSVACCQVKEAEGRCLDTAQQQHHLCSRKSCYNSCTTAVCGVHKVSMPVGAGTVSSFDDLVTLSQTWLQVSITGSFKDTLIGAIPAGTDDVYLHTLPHVLALQTRLLAGPLSHSMPTLGRTSAAELLT